MENHYSPIEVDPSWENSCALKLIAQFALPICSLELVHSNLHTPSKGPSNKNGAGI